MSSTSAGRPDTTELAIDRTWLAYERTLMAWTRTATAMISFGFTIYKFFEFEAGSGTRIARGLLTPRGFALIIVSIGLITLLLATLAHHRDVKALGAHVQGRPRSLARGAVYVVVFGNGHVPKLPGTMVVDTNGFRPRG